MYYILRQQQNKRIYIRINGPLVCFFFHLERTHQFNIAGEYGAHVFQKTQHTDVIKSMYTAKAIEHRDVE